MSTTHQLKTWPMYFQAIQQASKNFELRRNDRNFQVGDVLELQEWDPTGETYTGQSVLRLVTYILFGPFDGLEKGFVCMSTWPAERRPADRAIPPRPGTAKADRADRRARS